MSAQREGLRARARRFLAGTDEPAPAPQHRAPATPSRKRVNPDTVVRIDPEWRAVAEQWLILDTRIKDLESKRTAAADALAELQPEGSAAGGGVDLIRAWHRGPFDMEELSRVLDVAMEKLEVFRKAGRLVTSVRRTRGPSSGVRPDATQSEDVRSIRAPTFIHEDGAQ